MTNWISAWFRTGTVTRGVGMPIRSHARTLGRNLRVARAIGLAVAENTALDLTLAIIPSTRVLIAKIRIRDRYLADQLRRAVT